MRYIFVGRKIPYIGKTLWELVGNLKNFGVGRLIKRTPTSDSELSFCKIVKVLPLPPNNDPFSNRVVTVWYEEIYKGKKCGVKKSTKDTDYSRYILIPRREEEEYLKRAEELEIPVKSVKKYCYWPPLYKELWEKHSSNHGDPIPKLKIKIANYEGKKIILEEGETKPSTCSLYKSELSVDEMYKEIVRLKKLIQISTASQQ